MSGRIEKIIEERIAEPNKEACLNFILEFEDLFNTSKGSAIKHQAWPGGYRDHITEVMEIALRSYWALREIRELPFTISDALLCCFLHDIEKIWKHALNLHDDLREIDKNRMLGTYFDLNDEHRNAIKYTHGEGDDYHPTDRIQGPLAAFVHHCDNTSARIWFDKPDPRDRSITDMKPLYRSQDGNAWDLSDPETYTTSWFPDKYLELDAAGLRKEVEHRIAHSLYYMDCWNPGWGDGGQRERVLDFGKTFAREIRGEDRRNDVMWLKARLFLILDEVENQC